MNDALQSENSRLQVLNVALHKELVETKAENTKLKTEIVELKEHIAHLEGKRRPQIEGLTSWSDNDDVR